MRTVLPTPSDTAANDDWRPWVLPLHSELIEALEWAAGDDIDAKDFADEVRALAKQLCRLRAKHLSADAQGALLEAIMAEVVGLGPLEPLLADPLISDILVNGHEEVFIERRGKLQRTDLRFADDAHLVRIIQRVAGRVGRRVDESSPTVDARLPDGSRVHAVVRPLALRGPTLSIRRFGVRPPSIDELVSFGSVLPEMVQLLAAAIEARVSFLISGGTGAGKTTLLNALSNYIPKDERIVTIEDAAELQLQHPHVVSLETRTANTEGAGAVTTRDLVRNSLRMRPDRILVGEVRGAEAMDMLQAMNTGHEGSLTTIHANDVGDALSRVEVMVSMTGYELPLAVVRQYIASGIRLVVHVARLKGGMRRVTRIAEIVGLDDGQYRLEEIYGFEQLGVDGHGMAHGEFYVTGYVPQCLRRIRAAGLNLSPELFAARRIRHNGRAQRESLLIPETNAGLAVAADSMPNDARPAVSPDDASLNVGSMDLAASIPEPSIEAASGAVLPAQVDLASSSCMPISVDAMATNVSHTLPPILAAATSNGAHVPTNGPPAPMHVLAALAMRQRQRESVEVALKGWAKDDGSTLAK